MSPLEKYFDDFRKNIAGISTYYNTPFGRKKIHYFDWIASGRLYKPIEDRIANIFGPFVANTHTGTSETGTRMTLSYHYAHDLIKKHVNAGTDDVIITFGSGMTSVVNKLQRIMGLKGCNLSDKGNFFTSADRPVIFLTHMEHHSNHTSWYETFADVVMIKPGPGLLIDLNELEHEVRKYAGRKYKIGAFTACSNVTGIITPYHEMAEIMHKHNGICFIDFAASAPYVNMNMHPENPLQKLDAIYFSPHKFLGGPGSSGVLIFNKSLYNAKAPDDSGGGTVEWTNPWGEYKYTDNIEMREDGGTPGFLQAIRAALAIKLKEEMGVDNILRREDELVMLAISGLRKVKGIKILADNVDHRLGVISFYHQSIHYNLLVKLLSDLYGIQVRGGCVCAGTYGHYLLEVSYYRSHEITEKINRGDLSDKPGWIRLSLHPTMRNNEVRFFMKALNEIIGNIDFLKKDYLYDPKKNEFEHVSRVNKAPEWLSTWFDIT
ncbi:MAG: aminotransferase class V-fold PLP-dependent enzyme [Bacteroidales bacterium]|nr:aminotransferase class V-fold PLP-dependent enzyme [Bacteroidales bacterium]MBN2763556.1 aminotransferase class V-fold PLP-dependent enzyme [Bacteroidales bacterium]